MKRWVYRHRTVTGSPEVLKERLRAELPKLLARAVGQRPNAPAGDGSFLLQLRAQIAGAPVHKTVRVQTGVATATSGRLVIPVTWEGDPLPHSFPAFDGTLELEPHSSVHAQLALIGTYRLPAGPLGAALDATVLHGLADRTVGQLVDGLADALTDPHTPEPERAVGTPMRVRDVMTRDPLVLHDNLPLRTAALLLFHNRIGGAPVQDDQGRLLGVLSEADLLEKQATPRTGLGRAAARSSRLRSAGTVGEASTRPARVTDADTTLHDAAREMLDHRVARLVVLDDSRVAGIVSRHDVLQALIRVDERIREDADAVLAGMKEPGVHLEVEWGHITAAGTISRLSRVNELQARLERVDGAMDVDIEAVSWQTDDVSPLTPVF